jgi:hypothetical protein
MPSNCSIKTDPLNMGPHFGTYKEKFTTRSVASLQFGIGPVAISIKSSQYFVDNIDCDVLFESAPVADIMFGWVYDESILYTMYIVRGNYNNLQALVGRHKTKTDVFNITMEFNLNRLLTDNFTILENLSNICGPFSFPYTDNEGIKRYYSRKDILKKLQSYI